MNIRILHMHGSTPICLYFHLYFNAAKVFQHTKSIYKFIYTVIHRWSCPHDSIAYWVIAPYCFRIGKSHASEDEMWCVNVPQRKGI